MAQSPRRRIQHHNAKDRGWAAILQQALDTALGESTAADLAKPRITVLAVSKNGARIEIELRFKSGERYCCTEPGCFVPTFDRAWWTQLRECLRASSDREPPPMTIKFLGVVEKGSRQRVLRSLGLPEASRGYTYVDGPNREREAR